MLHVCWNYIWSAVYAQVFSYREARVFVACEFKRGKRVCKRESLYSLNFSRICVNKVSLLRCSCLFRFEGSRTHARRIIRLVIPRTCCRRCISGTNTRASIIPNIHRCSLDMRYQEKCIPQSFAHNNLYRSDRYLNRNFSTFPKLRFNIYFGICIG